MLKNEIDPASGKSFLLTELESFVELPANANALAEQIRRFRRLFLYANSDGRSEQLRQGGWEIRAFVASRDDKAESDSTFAVYMQPPIIEPEDNADVSDEQSCPFYLFALVKRKGGGLTAEEALHWEYEHFLGDQYRAGKETALPGWDDYMIGFKERFVGDFVATARLKQPRLGPSYESAKAILDLIKRMQRRSPVLARLDITL